MTIKDYDTAIRLKPNKTVLTFTYVKRANAKLDSGDNIGAIEDYNAAIRLQPKSSVILAVAYLNCGLARFNMGDTIGAIRDYSKVIRLKPKMLFWRVLMFIVPQRNLNWVTL